MRAVDARPRKMQIYNKIQNMFSGVQGSQLILASQVFLSNSSLGPQHRENN